MTRLVFFFLTLLFSAGTLAFSPDTYVQQVLNKDLPRSLRWYEKLSQAQQMSQADTYNLFQGALPETQDNQQLGISVRGSVDRMILLLEGSRYFPQVQNAPVEFRDQKEKVLHTLQVSKDLVDRFQYGEDPQALLEEWQRSGIIDFAQLSADVMAVFTQLQQVLNQPVLQVVEQKVDAEDLPDKPTESSVAEAPMVPLDGFEAERLKSYTDSAEVAKVAGECQEASAWKTDQADYCQKDDSIECDRSYARQCKKLH